MSVNAWDVGLSENIADLLTTQCLLVWKMRLLGCINNTSAVVMITRVAYGHLQIDL